MVTELFQPGCHIHCHSNELDVFAAYPRGVERARFARILLLVNWMPGDTDDAGVGTDRSRSMAKSETLSKTAPNSAPLNNGMLSDAAIETVSWQFRSEKHSFFTIATTTSPLSEAFVR